MKEIVKFIIIKGIKKGNLTKKICPVGKDLTKFHQVALGDGNAWN